MDDNPKKIELVANCLVSIEKCKKVKKSIIKMWFDNEFRTYFRSFYTYLHFRTHFTKFVKIRKNLRFSTLILLHITFFWIFFIFFYIFLHFPTLLKMTSFQWRNGLPRFGTENNVIWRYLKTSFFNIFQKPSKTMTSFS